MNYYAAGLTGRVKYLSSGMFSWPPLGFCSGRIVFSVYRNIWRHSQSLPQGPSSQTFFMHLAERVRRAGTNQARNWGCGRVDARVPGPSHSLGHCFALTEDYCVYVCTCICTSVLSTDLLLNPNTPPLCLKASCHKDKEMQEEGLSQKADFLAKL